VLATFIGLAAVTALALASTAASAPPGYRVLFSGEPAGGGAWDLSAKRQSIGGQPALCLSFTTKSENGFGFSNSGCAGGSLRAWKNVYPIASGYSTTFNTMNLVGGFAVGRARKAVISFADGKRLTVATRLGPTGMRRALGEPVRFFVVNAYPRTRARARSIAVLDAAGHEIGRSKLGA
jgi:hypothetical protein